MENSQILEHIGKTKTKKLIDEIQSGYHEIKDKTIGVKDNSINPNSVVTVTKDEEIKSIGMSCLNDLLLDNFARLYTVCIPKIQTGGFKDISGVLHTLRSLGGEAFNINQTQSIGSQVQIGQGTTPANILDFQIETPFVGGAESVRRNVGIGVYSVGLSKASVSTQIAPVSNSGAISETVFYGRYKEATANDVPFTFALSRDNISPVVNFSPADQVNIDYGFVFN